MATSKQRRADAIERLRGILKPGDTVYTVLRHVSSSGMTRHISLIAGDYNDITWYVMHALQYRRSDKTGGLIIGGCGMDMGFHVVYNLGRTLWPDGTNEPHGTRNGEPDTDGGYALNQRWL